MSILAYLFVYLLQTPVTEGQLCECVTTAIHDQSELADIVPQQFCQLPVHNLQMSFVADVLLYGVLRILDFNFDLCVRIGLFVGHISFRLTTIVMIK